MVAATRCGLSISRPQSRHFPRRNVGVCVRGHPAARVVFSAAGTIATCENSVTDFITAPAQATRNRSHGLTVPQGSRLGPGPGLSRKNERSTAWRRMVSQIQIFNLIHLTEVRHGTVGFSFLMPSKNGKGHACNA